MSNNYKLDPLKDHLVLQEIFSNLTLFEVTVARFVCRNWGEEGALNLRHRVRALNIHVNPPHLSYIGRVKEVNLQFEKWNTYRLATDRGALRDFLSRYKLDHTLHLSLLPSFPWQLSTTRLRIKSEKVYPLIYQVYYLQENELNFAANILNKYLPKVAPFVKELRLELMLKNTQDFQMLEKILKVVEQVEKCCLEIVAFSDKLLQETMPTLNHKSSNVKILSIRLVPATNITHTTTVEQSLPVPGPICLLSLFPNISFLDIIGLRPLECRHRPMANKILKLIRAAKTLNLKLDGIRFAPRTALDFQAIIDFVRSNPLKYLYLNICWKQAKSGDICNDLEEIIEECAATLERFDLEWRPIDAEACPNLRLPPLENLKSLTYSSKFMGRNEPDIVGRFFEDEILTECLGFRQLFADSGTNLKLKFPALESLSFIFVEPGDRELWKEIFPPENNENCISSKIQTLVVTFAGECESEKIQRFPRTLFPNLMQFRYVFKSKMLLNAHVFDCQAAFA